MRVLLRQIKSGLYYAGGSRWTRQPSRALDIQNVDKGGRIISTKHLSGVELVLRYDNPGLKTRFSETRKKARQIDWPAIFRAGFELRPCSA